METSKVLVTYTDPSAVYPAIAEPLGARLPLRNLNWNSTSRPFRSIPSLHVDLLRDAASIKPLKEVEGDWAIKSDESKEEDARQGRRHQFPGLRQSPYLKLYLLKCDDVDTYRANARKDIREWINGHTPESQKSSSSGKRDNHDAFEWLIVQIIDKANDRSSTPDPLNDNKKDGASKRFSTLSRMSSRTSSSNVIEKLRSDFNGTSKHAVDRVVQISLEGDKFGFDDLVTKMKALILASFDLRVAQYEDDIKEKEMQRTLPGWNFNTFFVLKEGLARGFEAVGLLEDALAGYHELATGLNVILEDQGGEDKPEKTAAPFNEYTEELREAYKHALSAKMDLADAISQEIPDLGSAILDTTRKDFRNLILSNNISVFDFQCYVFAREFALLLRLANAGIERSNIVNGHRKAPAADDSNLAKSTNDLPENLFVLAEACQLASEFITLTAGRMRKDIEKSIQNLEEDSSEGEALGNSSHQVNVIDNLISSWISSASERVLEATTSQTLSTQLRPLLSQLLPGKKFDSDVPQPISVVSRRHERLPDRTSSLTGASKPKTPFQENFSSISTPDGLRLLPPGTSYPGAQELAAQRGSLFVLSRRALCTSAHRIHGWQGSAAAATTQVNHLDLEDVNLDDTATEHDASKILRNQDALQKPTTQGIQNENLALALRSEYEFFKDFEELTAMALAHYIVGTRTNAAEGMTADLAIVRFNLKDYKSAALHFDQLASFYSKSGWTLLEVTTLDLYAQCLKELGRAEAFIRVALKANAARIERHGFQGHTGSSLKEIIAASSTLLHPLTVSLDDHFNHIQLDPFLRHYPSHDGFQMVLHLYSLLREPFSADLVRIKIASADKDQSGEHWLSADGPQEVGKGQCKFLVGTKEMHCGWYRLVGINIHVKNIVFVHDRLATSTASFFSVGRDSGTLDVTDVKNERFLIWARSQHLNAELWHSDAIDLRRPKSVKIEISSGWNRIHSGRLSIKAASAGLRLDTAEAKAQISSEGNDIRSCNISTKKYQPGAIDFGLLLDSSSLVIQIPYSLESDLNDIAIKVQVEYKTDAGEFTYAADCKVNISLPVSINVQDIFRKNALFPKFTIGTATAIPLRLVSCLIEGNSHFDAVSPATLEEPIDIFARQPYSFVSKIQKKRVSDDQVSQLSKPSSQRLLHLQIEYQCLEKDISARLERSLRTALEASSLQYFMRILKYELRRGIQSRFTANDYETICLLREVSKGTFGEYGWKTLLNGLSPADRQKLEAALREWHQHSPLLALDSNNPHRSQQQYLTVPFDLPSTNFVHTARLQINDRDIAAKMGLAGVAVDLPIPMQLQISHTRSWDSDLKPDSEADANDFSYEVHTSPDTWLIGGQRKAKFRAREGETNTFALVLVPQTAGRLLYPSVEITPVSKGRREHDDTRPEAQHPSSEVDYLSQCETVLVVPNLASTTVSLDPANGAWLIESKSREL